MAVPKITILISGNGSNFQAIIDAIKSGEIEAEIDQVISSSPTAYGLERASKASIPSKVHQLKDYYKGIPKENKEGRKIAREKFNDDLANLIVFGSKNSDSIEDKVPGYNAPNLIVCAGWMLILSSSFLTPIEKFNIPIINLHPALPGAFDGTHAIDRCWKAGQDGLITKGGVMIHKVIQEVDRGEPLIVKELNLIIGEPLDAYEDRVHKVEHVAIVEGTVKALKELVFI
ncbi:phosphoribosylglycinamide formyltransferase [Ascoidea rubescens DSM 1968]|uniref:Phosphoribosylglycinamide formyltransferase n=1 Tax=Ascoidea rubescens DSM 1968 TaxID=1344418 RepID=A0A1D2VDM4_9ASCO|nr:phosphoribosylglycinamide formyltransferase [Ascoidea rubescens DSM 1968]ODV59808.1 phosphoribosylglycinamide formyltransferase [Ascoidea rubescens DSM 1968]